jgi:hypothetical protein
MKENKNKSSVSFAWMPNEILRKNILLHFEILSAIFAKTLRLFHPGFYFLVAVGARN